MQIELTVRTLFCALEEDIILIQNKNKVSFVF